MDTPSCHLVGLSRVPSSSLTSVGGEVLGTVLLTWQTPLTSQRRTSKQGHTLEKGSIIPTGNGHYKFSTKFYYQLMVAIQATRPLVRVALNGEVAVP